MYGYVITIWLFNIAMEDCLFIDGLPIKHVFFWYIWCMSWDGMFTNNRGQVIDRLTQWDCRMLTHETMTRSGGG